MTICLDSLDTGRHSWETRGLDIRGDELVSGRRCVWCNRYEYRPYSPAPRRKTWRLADTVTP